MYGKIARAAALLLLAGCGGEGGTPAPQPQPPAPVAQPAPADAASQRPATRTAEIEIEGTPEPVALRLYTPPAGFPLRFTTYLPEEMEAETASSGEGDAVRFVARFGGRLEPRALVSLFVHPEGTDETAARQHADALASGAGRSGAGREQRHAWSIHERQYRGPGDVVGQVAVGRQGGRYYSISVEYPPEYGDGFAPRAQLVIDEIEWGEGQ
jgi:hypothetical protein